MSFDSYASLAENEARPKRVNESGLASGFVDGCTAWSTRGGDAKNEARQCYMKRAQESELSLPGELKRLLDPTLDDLPMDFLPRHWLGIEVTFTLDTPWYSKDDRAFHVFDNPVRKDRVFGVPYMSAASWKGLLRWAMGMTSGLIGPEPIQDTDARKKAEWAILHLFGNEKGVSDDFQRGGLAFFPTWFSKIGFEVINPHSRKTRAGTHPIYYEVVPAGAKGTLRLLYAPPPGQAHGERVNPHDALVKLLDAINDLLTVYGFSAKRTAGWGIAKIEKWVVRNANQPHEGDLGEIKRKLPELLRTTEATP